MIQVSNAIESRILAQLLEEMREHNKLLRRIADDVHSIWGQLDDTPVGFRITERKL